MSQTRQFIQLAHASKLKKKEKKQNKWAKSYSQKKTTLKGHYQLSLFIPKLVLWFVYKCLFCIFYIYFISHFISLFRSQFPYSCLMLLFLPYKGCKFISKNTRDYWSKVYPGLWIVKNFLALLLQIDLCFIVFFTLLINVDMGFCLRRFSMYLIFFLMVELNRLLSSFNLSP